MYLVQVKKSEEAKEGRDENKGVGGGQCGPEGPFLPLLEMLYFLAQTVVTLHPFVKLHIHFL